jgi:hypothetical protein
MVFDHCLASRILPVFLAATCWGQTAGVPKGVRAGVDDPATIAAAGRTLAELEEKIQTGSGARPGLIARMGMLAFKVGNLAKAEIYGQEALSDSLVKGPHQAHQTFYGNEVLGLVAIKQGNVNVAKDCLIRSAQIQPDPLFVRFGPNTLLADAVLEAGGKDAVLQFLELWKPLWPQGKSTLLQWVGAIQAGAVPNFGQSLIIMP